VWSALKKAFGVGGKLVNVIRGHVGFPASMRARSVLVAVIDAVTVADFVNLNL
jgi:hypothetical protein